MKTYSYKDLKISFFGLGCAQFGQEYGIGNKDLYINSSEIKLIIDKSIESGINFFDTASDYGKSEEILGKFLSPHKGKNIVVATKVKYIKDKSINAEIIKKRIKDSLESSLKKLQRDCLDMVYIHQYRLFFKFPEIFLELLNNYKKKGFIKHIGISLYEPHEIDEAIKYNEIDIFQIPYNVLNRSFEENNKIRMIKEREKLVILRSIFLQGLFFTNPDSLPEYFKPIKQTLKIFYEEIKKHFNSKEEFFLGYVLNKNYGPVILGIYSLSQLISNLRVFNLPLKKNVFQEIEEKIPNIDKIYTNPRNWILS